MENELVQDIIVSVDIVIFTIHKGQLQVLLIQRDHEPFTWYRSLPGSPVRDNETCEWGVERMLYEKIWLKRLYYEQLYTFSELQRDPRWRTISVSFMSIGKEFQIAWWPVVAQFHDLKRLPNLGFDHELIIKYAYQRLKYKLEYTNVAQYFLEKRFTLSELQQVYEIIMGYKIDVRNFRKKIMSLHIIKETGKLQTNVKNRPAMLYEFITKNLYTVNGMIVSSLK